MKWGLSRQDLWLIKNASSLPQLFSRPYFIFSIKTIKYMINHYFFSSMTQHIPTSVVCHTFLCSFPYTHHALWQLFYILFLVPLTHSDITPAERALATGRHNQDGAATQAPHTSHTTQVLPALRVQSTSADGSCTCYSQGSTWCTWHVPSWPLSPPSSTICWRFVCFNLCPVMSLHMSLALSEPTNATEIDKIACGLWWWVNQIIVFRRCFLIYFFIWSWKLR